MHTNVLHSKKKNPLIMGFDFYCCIGMKCLSIAVNMFFSYNESLCFFLCKGFSSASFWLGKHVQFL